MIIPEDLKQLNRGFFAEISFATNCENVMNCIPFIGAGMSADFGFPLWTQLIAKIAEDLDRQDILEDLTNGKMDFEQAASELYQAAGDKFLFRKIGENLFNKNVTDDEIAGSAVELLPYLFGNRLIITTNYDNVLSDVYAKRAGGTAMSVLSFQDDVAVQAALFNMAPAIFKLHGDFNIGREYILTKEQYNRYYNNCSFKRELYRVLTTRSLFFLGCSLEHERFLDVWGEEIRNNPHIHHYAILEADEDETKQRDRRERFEGKNITVIWYPHGRHDRVRDLLEIIGKKVGRLDYDYPAVAYQHSFVERKDAFSTENLMKTIYGNSEDGLLSSIQGDFQSKFIYITGLGGIGKTTLLNQLYHQIEKKINSNVPEDIKIFHMEFCGDWSTTLKTRKINIKSKRRHYILFVDNLPEDWYVKEGEEFKQFAGRCQIFATSRARMTDADFHYAIPNTEQRYYVDLGWNFPNPEDLFMKYFNPSDPELFKGNASIKEIIQISGGHTLAIEILANHARERCKGTNADGSVEIIQDFLKELKENKFDLSELCDIRNLNNNKNFYEEITDHLAKLVQMDELSEGEKELMRTFSLLADALFHPEHIQYQFPYDCMDHLIRLGWIQVYGADDYVMHEIVKKLAYDRERNDEFGYLKIRNLVACLARTLTKRNIEKAGRTVFDEMDTIHHAQSIYDYLKRILPQQEDVDILDVSNPYNDSDFVEMINNLFSSYDDIDLRDKAFLGSQEAELLSRNTHDYALYTYAVSANSIGFLCAHSQNNRLPNREHLQQAFTYLKNAEKALDEMFDQSNKEARILRGKILSNYGACYNACLKLDTALKREKIQMGEPADKELEDRILQDFQNAVKYHTQSLELRTKLYDEYGDEDLPDFIFTSKENIANDYFQSGHLAEAVSLRLSFLPDFEKYYGDKVHTKKFVTLRNLGDTCKYIVLELKQKKEVSGVSQEDLPKYKEMAIQYLEKAKIMRRALDNHKDIIGEIDKSLELLREQ